MKISDPNQSLQLKVHLVSRKLSGFVSALTLSKAIDGIQRLEPEAVVIHPDQ